MRKMFFNLSLRAQRSNLEDLDCRVADAPRNDGLLLAVILLLMVSLPAIAQEQAVDVNAQFKLFVDAIETAAQVDAYNGYCGIDTQMSADLVKRVEMAGLIEEGDDALRNFQQEHYIYFAQGLKDKAADCKSVDFLLEKLDVFKKMKQIMGVINGDSQSKASK